MYLGVWPADGASPDAPSNFLAALVRRLERVCAPRANRARDLPEAGIRLGPGVLNPC
jgi:hypothetical protein